MRIGMRDIDLLVVGDLNPDLIVRGDVEPAFGQTEKLVEDVALVLGSSSGIFACGSARLGLRVTCAGKVGDDEFGRFVINELAARQVDTSGIVIDPTIKTGLGVALSKGDDRAILTYLGSIATLRYQDINESLLHRARHLHVGSYYLLDALRADVPTLFEQAHALGLTTSLDTNYDPAETWNGGLRDVLLHTDIFLPNETELRAITGQDNLQLALFLLSEQVPIVAVKLGPQGAIARQGKGTFQAEALPISVVDTTGAGDSFDAGFIYGYLAGWEMQRALRLGCVCGSLSTRAAGGIAAQPTLAEALAAM
jgi:sugar/nucleoside kinase (ribokinase family)